jgi:hypothetical protein
LGFGFFSIDLLLISIDASACIIFKQQLFKYNMDKQLFSKEILVLSVISSFTRVLGFMVHENYLQADYSYKGKPTANKLAITPENDSHEEPMLSLTGHS